MSRIFQPSISISLPGVDNHDTERRRQIALKALSDRLNKAAGAPGSGGAGSNSGMLCECRYTTHSFLGILRDRKKPGIF